MYSGVEAALIELAMHPTPPGKASASACVRPPHFHLNRSHFEALQSLAAMRALWTTIAGHVQSAAFCWAASGHDIDYESKPGETQAYHRV